jgi:hypothetical protein
MFLLKVPSSDIRPGCGYEGAAIEFFVEGERANLTGIWQAGAAQQTSLIAGHSFAFFCGGLGLVGPLGDKVVVPYLNGEACGYSYMGPSGYQAIVYSEGQEQGCGTEGAEMSFKLVDAQTSVVADLVPVVAAESVLWHSWDGVSSCQVLNLMRAPAIQVGSVGDGSGAHISTGRRGMATAALGLLLLLAATAALALRKRTIQ